MCGLISRKCLARWSAAVCQVLFIDTCQSLTLFDILRCTVSASFSYFSCVWGHYKLRAWPPTMTCAWLVRAWRRTHAHSTTEQLLLVCCKVTLACRMFVLNVSHAGSLSGSSSSCCLVVITVPIYIMLFSRNAFESIHLISVHSNNQMFRAFHWLLAVHSCLQHSVSVSDFKGEMQLRTELF